MSTTEERQYPSSRYAWYMVVVLTIAYILSFVDRYVFGLLIEPIKADFGLTDLQIALVGSTAFAIFYATMGLPLGYLADRTRRTWMLGIGVLVWSAATVACGLAKNFVQMFLARMAVGAGEATLGPCAMSMISDSFPREKRGKPIAFYSAALSLGAGIASLVSATILVWANSVPELSMPIVGVVKPWQFVFIVVGLPGILVAALMLTLREPPRQIRKDDADKRSIRDTLKHFRRNWKVFSCCLAFASFMVIVAYSQFFYAPMFQRTWGLGSSAVCGMERHRPARHRSGLGQLCRLYERPPVQPRNDRRTAGYHDRRRHTDSTDRYCRAADAPLPNWRLPSSSLTR